MRNTKVFIGLMLVVALSVAGIFAIIEWKTVSPVLYEGKVEIIMGDQLVSADEWAQYSNGVLYMPYETVHKYISENIALSEDQKRIFIPLKDRNIVLEDEAIDQFIKQNEIQVNIPTRSEEGIPYIPITLLKKILGIEVEYLEETQRVIIDPVAITKRLGEVKENRLDLKEKPGKLGSSLGKLKLGEQVIVFGEEGDWYRIRGRNGDLGYVEKKHITISDPIENPNMQLNIKREVRKSEGEKINLTWEYVHEKSPNLKVESRIQSLDVIVPTWFNIADESGTVINKGNRDYVDEAHKKGYKVWGLVNNDFDPKLTSKILQDPQKRKKVIGQLLVYASLYNLDGINIDFENINYEDKGLLVEFVKELRYYSKKQNIILSIDVTVPSSSERWSKVYDRKALSDQVDYVAVMAYDEHWATSPVSGSVASVPWVERGIIRSMETIPSEKILLGLPFYTRVWKEYKDDTGKQKVESKAVSMKRAKEILEEKNAVVIWNEEIGQYYGQYEEEGATFKVWLEDSKSIALKTALVEKHGLAGTASWRRGFEEQNVWIVLNEMIKRGKKFHELSFENN